MLQMFTVYVFDPVASAECKRRGLEDSPASRREVLGSVLYDIRFPAMNVQDFADHAATSGSVYSLDPKTDPFEIWDHLKTWD